MNRIYKIAGLVVLYNPGSDVVKNIESYLRQVEKLFVIDNSAYSNSNLISKLSSNNIEYIPNNKNIGLAAALNLGAKLAIDSGYDFLLTMDQDSIAPDRMINSLFERCKNYNCSQIGIISPFHSVKNYNTPSDEQITENLIVMTSGNLLNLKTYSKAGPFEEKFFIDYIDYEYCLRLNSMGFKVLTVNTVHLTHNLGTLEKRKFFFRNVAVTHHSPERLYYRTRNRLFIIKVYKIFFPDFCNKEKWGIVNDLIKIILYEKDKRVKIRMVLKGIKDFRKNIWGQLIQT